MGTQSRLDREVFFDLIAFILMIAALAGIYIIL